VHPTLIHDRDGARPPRSPAAERSTLPNVSRVLRLTLPAVGYGVAVRAGAAKPDISSPEALKRTLLAAKSIVYTDPASGGASGVYFEKVLDRLGIAKEVKAKSILNAWPATKPSAEFVARGEAELGIQLISEIVAVPDAELLGPLPAELQSMNVASRELSRPHASRKPLGRCSNS
jgi:ABC-type molybdate transport system substrate-binding protein